MPGEKSADYADYADFGPEQGILRGKNRRLLVFYINNSASWSGPIPILTFHLSIFLTRPTWPVSRRTFMPCG